MSEEDRRRILLEAGKKLLEDRRRKGSAAPSPVSTPLQATSPVPGFAQKPYYGFNNNNNNNYVTTNGNGNAAATKAGNGHSVASEDDIKRIQLNANRVADMLMQEKTVLLGRVEQLCSELRAEREERERMEGERERMELALRETERELDTWRERIKERDASKVNLVVKLQMQVAELQMENEGLKGEVRVLGDREKDEGGRSLQLAQQLEESRMRCAHMEEALNLATNERQALEAELIALKQHVGEEEGKREGAVVLVGEMDKRLRDREDKHKEELKAISALLAEKSEACKKLATQLHATEQHKLKELSATREAEIKKQLADMQKRVDDTDAEKQQLVKEAQLYKSKLARFEKAQPVEEEKRPSPNINNIAQSEETALLLQQHQKRFAEMEAEKQDLLRRMETLDADYQAAAREVQLNKAKLAHWEQGQGSENRKLSPEAAELQKRIVELEVDMQELTKEAHLYKTKLSHIEKAQLPRFRELYAKIDAAEQQVEILKQQLASGGVSVPGEKLDPVNDSKHKEEIERLQEKLHEQQRQNEALVKSKSQLMAQVGAEVQRNGALVKERSALNDALRDSKAELVKLQSNPSSPSFHTMRPEANLASSTTQTTNPPSTTTSTPSTPDISRTTSGVADTAALSATNQTPSPVTQQQTITPSNETQLSQQQPQSQLQQTQQQTQPQPQQQLPEGVSSSEEEGTSSEDDEDDKKTPLQPLPSPKSPGWFGWWGRKSVPPSAPRDL